MIKNAFIISLTKAINAYLDLDPESKQRIQRLQDKAITVELLPFHFVFQCEFKTEGVCIHSGEPLATQATIRGTPLQMLNVMLMPQHRQRFFAEDLTMDGDAAFAQEVVELFDRLNIDWEEYVSHFMGDIPTYHASRFLKGIRHWFSATEKSMTHNINEYIHEELNWLPTREALQDFFAGIDHTRMDVDRAEARINHLKLQLKDNEASQ
jgi:ubiquinone biosynthesis protein UbiJ